MPCGLSSMVTMKVNPSPPLLHGQRISSHQFFDGLKILFIFFLQFLNRYKGLPCDREFFDHCAGIIELKAQPSEGVVFASHIKGGPSCFRFSFWNAFMESNVKKRPQYFRSIGNVISGSNPLCVVLAQQKHGVQIGIEVIASLNESLYCF